VQSSGSVHGAPAATPCTPRLEGLESVTDFFQVLLDALKTSLLPILDLRAGVLGNIIIG